MTTGGHLFSQSLRVVNFLVLQENLNQAIEEGPLVSQISNSEVKRRHLSKGRGHAQGWSGLSESTIRCGESH